MKNNISYIALASLIVAIIALLFGDNIVGKIINRGSDPTIDSVEVVIKEKNIEGSKDENGTSDKRKPIKQIEQQSKPKQVIKENLDEINSEQKSNENINEPSKVNEVQQLDMELTCGESIEKEFTLAGEEHYINLKLEAGDVVEIELEPLGEYLNLAAQLIDPNDIGLVNDIGTFGGKKKRKFNIKSGMLSGNGIYTLKVTNWIKGNASHGSNRTGVYSISVSCIKRDSKVNEVQQLDMELTCGKSIEKEFTLAGEEHLIKLKLEAGDVVEIGFEPLGEYLNLAAQLIDPNDIGLVNDIGTFGSKKKRKFNIKSGVLSGNGIYTLKVTNWIKGNASHGSNRTGVYSISVSCIKRDGKVIKD